MDQCTNQDTCCTTVLSHHRRRVEPRVRQKEDFSAGLVRGQRINNWTVYPFSGYLCRIFEKRVLSDATRDDGFCNCLANNNFGHLPTFVAPDELTPGDESTTFSDPDYSHVRVEA